MIIGPFSNFYDILKSFRHDLEKNETINSNNFI